MDEIKEYGQVKLDHNNNHKNIFLLSIIGEIEGHENVASGTKATKYEHILPMLAKIEDDQDIDVSLVLGGSHSIGVPLAVSADYSFIVPTGTMVIHPVRMNGMFIGVPQTYEYFKKIQERINDFVINHCHIRENRFSELMNETEILTKDVGSILVGKQTVKEGIIDEIGGLKDAMKKLYELVDRESNK